MISTKEFNEEVKEICKYFNLKYIGTINSKNYIPTSWGTYHFYFSEKSIFGRFEHLKTEELPERFQLANGNLYHIKHFPNIYTGKMNFHYEDIYDFIDVFDRIWQDN